MDENFDEIIDFLLNSVKEKNGIDTANLLDEASKSFFKIEKTRSSLKYFDFMKNEDLVTFDNDNRYRITRNGLLIIENGGWLKYIENQNKRADFERHKSEIEFKNHETTLELNKWFLKTKWLPHLLAFTSIVFSIFTYFDAKNDSKILEQRIKKLEQTISIIKVEPKKPI